MEHYRTSNPNITWLDRNLAVPMFIVAFVFLVLTGLMLPTLLYRDIDDPIQGPAKPAMTAADGPNVEDMVDRIEDFLILSEQPDEYHEVIIYFMPRFRQIMLQGMIFLYGLILLEGMAHWLAGGRQLKQHLLYAVFPFMRLSFIDHVDGSHVWVVGMGWLKRTRLLERRLTSAFSVPMIGIALPIIPLIIIQLIWSQKVNTDLNLKFLMATATALIWIAFVFEFAVMFSVTTRKLKYCKEHWINMVIIGLPLIGFLRIAALGGLIKVKQLAKTVSVLRLRGIFIRFLRALIVLGIIDRIMRRKPEQKIEKLEKLIEEKEEELEILRWEMSQIQAKIESEVTPETPPPKNK